MKTLLYFIVGVFSVMACQKENTKPPTEIDNESYYYHDLIPDIQLERDDSLSIDIDGNGIDDLKVMNTAQYQGIDRVNDTILLSFGKCTGGSGCPEADTIAYGEKIGFEQEWYAGFWLWKDKIEYIGARKNSSPTSFGWINIKKNGEIIIVREFFFSKNPENEVRAGLVE